MGQQQLLLLVLGIVIVGLAVVVGINAFSENNIKSNADALVTDGLRIASDVQAYALKPTQFGGGGGASSLATLAAETNPFPEIGYPEGANGCAATEYGNVNGCFTINATLDGACTAPTIPSSNTAQLYITANNANTGNTVCVAVAGTRSDDIGTDVDYGT